jgi:hypothetical protein
VHRQRGQQHSGQADAQHGGKAWRQALQEQRAQQAVAAANAQVHRQLQGRRCEPDYDA